MGKDLSKMTLEELWVLFPIFLVAHDERWEAYYKEIEQELSGLLADQTVIRISHIGSTAIQGIWAKNIGDNDELYFRDYLNDHPDVAKEYETLKLRLWKQLEHNRDAYTDAKTDFISKWTAEARKECGDRY